MVPRPAAAWTLFDQECIAVVVPLGIFAGLFGIVPLAKALGPLQAIQVVVVPCQPCFDLVILSKPVLSILDRSVDQIRIDASVDRSLGGFGFWLFDDLESRRQTRFLLIVPVASALVDSQHVGANADRTQTR